MAKEFSFTDLNKEMKKNSKYGDTLDKSTISEIDHFIPTGNFHLNACLTGSLKGGFPNNRAVALAGPSGTGKTYLLLNAIKQAQDMGYSIIFYDSENAVDKELVEKFGIDSSKFRYEPCNTVQEFRSSVTAVTDLLIEQKNKGVELPKVLIALDSAGNLATQKEIDDAKSGSSKADMTRAKLLKSTFRILMTKFGICKIPFLFTNHTYQTQDLFSKQVGGGGCLVPGSKVVMNDSSLKNIEDIVEGDQVLTLMGPKEIKNIWTFEKKTYKIEFEDSSVIECSEDHRFFIGNETDDPLDNKNWVFAKDLVKNNKVSRYKNKQLKVNNVTELKSTKVHDLTVADVQHYITDNGVINHNTGPEYAASIILFLGKAKLKEGTVQTGIIVTARPNKNRFAKPLPIKFHISFSKGMNPYVGLEEYISWDVCGIERGRFINKNAFNKLTEIGQKECREHTYTKNDKEVTVYFQPAATARKLCVKHLNDTVDLNQLFTPEVMTAEVLESIEPMVNEKFSYGDDVVSGEDLTKMLSNDED